MIDAVTPRLQGVASARNTSTIGDKTKEKEDEIDEVPFSSNAKSSPANPSQRGRVCHMIKIADASCLLEVGPNSW